MKRNLPCELHVGDDVHPASTVEIEEHRLLVQCDANLTPGMDLDVRIPPLSELPELWIKARVARGSMRGPRQLPLRVIEAPSVYQVLTLPGVEIDVSNLSASQVRGLAAAASVDPIVLLDAGDLDPIAGLLDELGLAYSRVTAHKGHIDGWPTPE